MIEKTKNDIKKNATMFRVLCGGASIVETIVAFVHPDLSNIVIAAFVGLCTIVVFEGTQNTETIKSGEGVSHDTQEEMK